MKEASPNGTAMDVAPLFQPIAIAACPLVNRLVMAPMTRNFARDGVLSEEATDYYRRRAEGGVGLILTEGIATSEIGAHSAAVPHLFGNDPLVAWRRVNAAVHETGCKIMAQLWHTGLGRMREASARPDLPSIGPADDYLEQGSALAAAGGTHPRGRALDQVAIDATIEEYAIAAQNAKTVGFDGIEIHAAHGYLIDQFFWFATNRRTDRYGGDTAARTRFGAEIVAEIRRRVGPDFPIGLRFSQWKLPAHYSSKALADPRELEGFLKPLVDAGVDFFDASTRRYWEPEFPEHGSLTLAGWTRKITGVTTMAVGSVGLSGPLETTVERIGERAAPEANLAPVIAMIERGECDLVGIGRALIANPDWPERIRTGRTGDLKPYSVETLATLW